MKKKTVGQVMTASPHTIGKDQTLSTAHAIMRQHRIRHLPVLEGGRIAGIVTERDLHLMETLRDVNPDDVRVEDAMTADPYCVAPDVLLADVVKTMAEHKYGAVVITQNAHVVGVFTAVDALRLLAEVLG